MWQPTYHISPKLLENIKKVAVLSADLNRRSIPQVVLVELEQRATTLSAHTSTAIEGNPLPLTEVKKILKTRPGHLRDSEREVINYNTVLQRMHSGLREGSLAFSLQTILDIHADIMAGLLEPYHCGRLRQEPVVVNNPRSGETIYWPPDHKDAEPLMQSLVAFITEHQARLDPVILAGLFHRQFVIIHPFTDGNGRTARLVTKLLLASMGIDTFYLFSFENFYNNNISRYLQQVGVTGNYYDLGRDVDFTPWLEYFSDGIIDELLRVQGELEKAEMSPQRDLKAHHRLILEHIRSHGFITDRDYAGLTERAKATRTLDFRKLMELGLIERLGRGRQTHYKLKG